MAWPFKDIYCPGLNDRVEYAQFLHDASEVSMSVPKEANWAGMTGHTSPIAINLPVVKPNVTVPVVELFLKG